MKRLASLFVTTITAFALAACQYISPSVSVTGDEAFYGETVLSWAESTPFLAETQLSGGSSSPKYVFFFIGDGMSYPQIQAAQYYLQETAAITDPENTSASADTTDAARDASEPLLFLQFSATGTAMTEDLNSLIPDSASAATAMASGYKTLSGAINVDETSTISYETIAEKVHEQLGYKVGIISSVNLNHATPAAFFAHQPSRNNYYEIGLELIESHFEFFAGGAFLSPNGENGDREDLYQLAAAAGYSVARTPEALGAITANDAKVLMIDANPADADAMAYEIDRTEDMWSLADYVAMGIDVLDNDNGFFLMTEAGKIDRACHANDAATAIQETIALSEAVGVAMDFAKSHPGETLILVAGDHETGGLSIGNASTAYSADLSILAFQTISHARFASDYVASYIADQTGFDTVLTDIEILFGLKAEGDVADRLLLSEYELNLLETAYRKSILGMPTDFSEEEEILLYGANDPLTVTVTHILNHKAGVGFTTYAHTGLPVAVFADGVGASEFNGYYDNTAIFDKLAVLLGVS